MWCIPVDVREAVINIFESPVWLCFRWASFWEIITAIK